MEKNRIVGRTFLVVVLLGIVLFSIFGEKVALEDGAGWDGAIYRDIAFNFLDKITVSSYDSYRIQRVIPFAIINVIYSVIGIPMTNSSLLIGMNLTNIIILLVGIYYFFKISKVLNLSLGVESIAFVSLFFNFQTLKNIGYYPFQTDNITLIVAIIIFYYFLTHNDKKLLFVGGIGAFIFPLFLLMSLILYVLPRTEFCLVDTKVSRTDKKYLLACKFFCVFILIPLFILVYYKNVYCQGNVGLSHFYDRSFYNYINDEILIFSSICTVVYIYRMLKPFSFSLKNFIVVLLKNINLKHVMTAAMLFVCIQLAIQIMSNNDKPFFSFELLVKALVQQQSVLPFIYVESSFLYYGLPYLLLLCFWTQFCNIIGKKGIGYFVIIVMAMILSINSESRRVINFLPFIVFPLCEIIKTLNLNKYAYVGYILFSFFFSMWWFPINVTGIEEAFSLWQEKNIVYEFPAQRYFMFTGWLQNANMYILFSSIMLSVFAVMCIGYKKGWFTEK